MTRVPFSNGAWDEVVTVSASQARTATQRERQLVKDYRIWRGLTAQQFSRRRIDIGSLRLFTDGYLDGQQTLLEAKSLTSREAIRTAIGQLYDYRRFLSPRPDLALLLPAKPTDDLLDLLEQASIAPIWMTPNGSFASTIPDLIAHPR